MERRHQRPGRVRLRSPSRKRVRLRSPSRRRRSNPSLSPTQPPNPSLSPTQPPNPSLSPTQPPNPSLSPTPPEPEPEPDAAPEPEPEPDAAPEPQPEPEPEATTTTHAPISDPAAVERDRDILVAFYESTGGDNWFLNQNWRSSAPLGQWYGVTTDSVSGRVIGLELGHNLLEGQIPSVFGELTALESLLVYGPIVSDLSVLWGLPSLSLLDVQDSRISDVSPLSSLTSLEVLNLATNKVKDLAPLLNLPKLHDVNLMHNPLSDESISAVLPILEARGVSIYPPDISLPTIGLTAQDGPQVYNDNLFVMPVQSGGTVRIQAYTEQFYRHFNDDFDFLILVDNRSLHAEAGAYAGAMNDVQGIGVDLFSSGSEFGSAGKLQGAIILSTVHEFTSGSGVTLHELMHRWSAFIMPSRVSDGVHWQTFSNVGGHLDGGTFRSALEDIVELGDNRYQATRRTELTTFSPLELYLAGFISPEDVPDFWVAADGEWVEFPNVFTASSITRYTIEDVIAAHGRRIPAAADSQRDFRAAVILLIDDDNPAGMEVLDELSSVIAWFSHAGSDRSRGYNFYDATGGRATMTMDGLSQSKKSSP